MAASDNANRRLPFPLRYMMYEYANGSTVGVSFGSSAPAQEESSVGTLTTPSAADTLVPEEPTPSPDATTSGGGATGRAVTKRPIIRK